MNSQQISIRSKKIDNLFLMLKTFKANNQYFDINIINTTYLLTFNHTIINNTFHFSFTKFNKF